jgi:hypothetical protein
MTSVVEYQFRVYKIRKIFAKKWSSYTVLERIWIKGSYLRQWLPQGERKPNWVKITMNWNLSWWVPLTKRFFQTNNCFFQEQKKFSKEQLLFSLFMYCKAKKKFGVIRKCLKFFDFQKSLGKLGPIMEDFNSSWFWLLRGSPFTLW